MGGRDWFQASVSAVGIPAVAGSDSGRDTGDHPGTGGVAALPRRDSGEVQSLHRPQEPLLLPHCPEAEPLTSPL